MYVCPIHLSIFLNYNSELLMRWWVPGSVLFASVFIVVVYIFFFFCICLSAHAVPPLCSRRPHRSAMLARARGHKHIINTNTEQHTDSTEILHYAAVRERDVCVCATALWLFALSRVRARVSTSFFSSSVSPSLAVYCYTARGNGLYSVVCMYGYVLDMCLVTGA